MKKKWVCQIVVGELYALFLILKNTIKIVSQLRSNPIKNLNCLNKKLRACQIVIDDHFSLTWDFNFLCWWHFEIYRSFAKFIWYSN